jgi:putative phosphoesterase
LAKIGLLSDAHGRGKITADAAALLVREGARRLIYLGDVGSPEVIDALLIPHPDKPDQTVPVNMVFGNVDWDVADLTRYATELGIQVDHPVGRMQFDDGSVMVYFHGDQSSAFDGPLHEQVRYLCHGHTHMVKDDRVGNTRIINPGALYRAGSYTVALLDTNTDQLTFFPIDKSC